MLAVGQKNVVATGGAQQLQINLDEPDLFLDSDSLSQLPEDLLAIPFLHDVLSEDFVFSIRSCRSSGH
ncbi:DUF2138 family protein [Shigella sonnei]